SITATSHPLLLRLPQSLATPPYLRSFPTRRSSDLPITLALRALPTAGRGRKGIRELLLMLLHSRYIRVITHPLFTIPMFIASLRSEEHTSELQSRATIVCGLLLEKTQSLRNTTINS